MDLCDGGLRRRVACLGALLLLLACGSEGDAPKGAEPASSAPEEQAVGKTAKPASGGDSRPDKKAGPAPPAKGAAPAPAPASTARRDGVAGTAPGTEGAPLPESATRSGAVVYAFGSGRPRGWASVRGKPDANAPVTGQALLGEPLAVRERKQGWILVESGRTGLRGWVPAEELRQGTETFARRLRRVERLALVVKAPGIRVDDSLIIPFGAVLPEGERSTPRVSSLLLPDGRFVPVRAGEAAPTSSVELSTALSQARELRGTRFQRGYNTPAGMDAEGLVQLVYSAAGVRLPRGTKELMMAGRDVGSMPARPGDVLFFDSFDQARPHPVILLDDKNIFLEAHPGSGVGIGFLDVLRNRKIVARRRYVENPPQEASVLPASTLPKKAAGSSSTKPAAAAPAPKPTASGTKNPPPFKAPPTTPPSKAPAQETPAGKSPPPSPGKSASPS